MEIPLVGSDFVLGDGLSHVANGVVFHLLTEACSLRLLLALVLLLIAQGAVVVAKTDF